MTSVYILTQLYLVGHGDYGEGGAHSATRNVSVTADRAEAERWRNQAVENDFEVFALNTEIEDPSVRALAEAVKDFSRSTQEFVDSLRHVGEQEVELRQE